MDDARICLDGLFLIGGHEPGFPHVERLHDHLECAELALARPRIGKRGARMNQFDLFLGERIADARLIFGHSKWLSGTLRNETLKFSDSTMAA